MSEARREMEKEQQILVNIEMYDEVQSTGIDAQDVEKLWIPSDGMEPDSTERDDDVAINEEWAYVEEQQVVEQATEESQNWCTPEMHDGRQVRCRKPLRRRTQRRANILRSGVRVPTLAKRRSR